MQLVIFKDEKQLHDGEPHHSAEPFMTFATGEKGVNGNVVSISDKLARMLELYHGTKIMLASSMIGNTRIHFIAKIPKERFEEFKDGALMVIKVSKSFFRIKLGHFRKNMITSLIEHYKMEQAKTYRVNVTRLPVEINGIKWYQLDNAAHVSPRSGGTPKTGGDDEISA